jgi:alcohol dehydrogenase (NADP+)
MTTTVKGYAAQSATSPLAPFQVQRRDMRGNDVLIDILYCGVCHSDLHMARNDWKNSVYPIVPGHEIIGRVVAIGDDVTRFKVGDCVGVGCLVDSCQSCASCEQGLEQYCERGFGEEGAVLTYNGVDRHDKTTTYGGYSEKIVVSEQFVLKIPANLDLKGAAPLLCAGITMWSPLRHWGVDHKSKVAIVGLGGLGHMGLKLAKAMGAEVTLFTRSPGKEEDARRLGADHIVISTDSEQMAAVTNKFDLIIDTVPYTHDLNPYVPTLALNGTLVLVGLVGDVEPAISTLPMIFGRKSIAGSVIGGIPETQEMLDFCGKHDITSDIELINMQDINDAYERMLKSDVKYRFVINVASLQNN